MAPDTRTGRTTFGEFGLAVVGEVLTPRFLQDHLNGALASMLRAPDWLAELPGELTSVRAGTPTLVEDDGFERRFAVTVHARMAAEVGPRALAFGIDANAELDLTVRARVFRPAVLRIDIDPVTPDDFRIRAHARTDWLPRALLDDGGNRMARAAQRSLPMVAAGVNRALASSARRRQVDVLERVRGYQQDSGDASARPRSGVLGPGEELCWPVGLDEQERATLRLWAGLDAPEDALRGTPPPWEPPAGSGTPAAPAQSLELLLSARDGTLVDALDLAVRRAVPDFDTSPTAVTVVATEAEDYQALLRNMGDRPLHYLLEERRSTVPGERIGFAEFGTVLIERGIDQDTVARAVRNQLARQAESLVDTPALVRGSATTRLAGVTEQPAEPDELRFGLTLDIQIELQVGPGANASVVTSTLRAEVPLRIWTTVEPASLRLAFDPVPPESLLFVEHPHRTRGRYVPIPQRKLAELLPRQVGTELNRRLERSGRRIIAAELAAGPPPGFTGDPVALREATMFAGTATLGSPGRHPVWLAEQQVVRVKTRVVTEAGAPEPGAEPAAEPGAGPAGEPATEPAVELAVCDERGGVWAADRAEVPADGEPVILGVEFTAPQAGQWRLRVGSAGGTGKLGYQLRVEPLAEDETPADSPADSLADSPDEPADEPEERA